jgi:hypothetical protein
MRSGTNCTLRDGSGTHCLLNHLSSLFSKSNKANLQVFFAELFLSRGKKHLQVCFAGLNNK